MGLKIVLAFLTLTLLAAFLQSSKLLASEKDKENTWTPIFRSDDPLIYNHDTGDPASRNGYAIDTDTAPQNVKFLRLKRMDTGAFVIVQINRALLGKGGALEGDLFWTGGTPVRGTAGHRNRLIGIARLNWSANGADDQLVRRVPHKMDVGYRGWGFSKAAASNTPDQTYSWEGKKIDKTIFEIAVKSEELTEAEKKHLLTGGGSPPPDAATADNSSESSEQSDSADHSVAGPGATTRIARKQSSIHALYVRETDTGEMLGQTSELILTATPGKPPRNGVTPVAFTTAAGKEMHMVLDDDLRYIRIKYPKWDASKVELSFEDKYTPKDGGSIGAAIGTLLLSMIEGFDVDPKLAITGDVTADGKVRAIGGVAAKTRGATAGGCTLMAVPADNYPQVVDAFIWEGSKLITNIQVIGIANLTDAEAVARIDRDDKLAQAITLFGDVQTQLAKSAEAVHSKQVIDKLTTIADLAPNHYSAKLLLALAQNKQPHKLSATASMYYTFVTIAKMDPTLLQHLASPAKGQVTPAVIKDGLRQLDKVRRLAAPETIPLVNAWGDFIKAMNDAETGAGGSSQVLRQKAQQVDDAMQKLQTNRDLMEKMMHEGI